MPDYQNPTRHGSQKGKFVGDPSAVHIHIVGSHNFDENNKGSVRDAYNWLGRTDLTDSSRGYGNCMNWLLARHGKL